VRAHRWIWLLGLAGCGFDGSAPGQGGPDVIDGGDAESDSGSNPGDDGSAAAGFRKSITIGEHGDLVDFPLYLELEDADLMARAAADGSDIYLTDAGGAVLDREVEGWDPDRGLLQVWVRVTLVSGADTVLFLRYGEASPAPPPDPPGVWSAGFAAVWHLEESPAGSLTDELGARHGVPSGGMTAASSVAGAIGQAIDLDGDDDMIGFDNPLAGASAHTISAWVRQEETANNDALVVVGTGECGEARWLHTRYDQDTVALGLYCDDLGDSGIDIQGDDWTLVHWTYSDGVSRLYVDGAQVGPPFNHDEISATAGSDGFIGNVPTAAGFGSNMGLNGAVDEVRIATEVRSADWIAAEHANQSDPPSFYQLGPEESL
jgi:hypothetical protein